MWRPSISAPLKRKLLVHVAFEEDHDPAGLTRSSQAFRSLAEVHAFRGREQNLESRIFREQNIQSRIFREQNLYHDQPGVHMTSVVSWAENMVAVAAIVL